jgi:CheY-like chemotaxis protein
LSQVYGFAQQSGGAITVTSRKGAGATFTLFLPRSEETTTVARPPPAGDAGGDAGRLLLVEDNSDVAEVTAVMLTDAGYEVTRAISASAALDILGRGEVFDVMLSDIVMEGGISGLDLTKRVLKERPGLPVVLMTGYSEALGQVNLKDVQVLFKPFAQPEVLTALRAARKRASART